MTAWPHKDGHDCYRHVFYTLSVVYIISIFVILVYSNQHKLKENAYCLRLAHVSLFI